MVNVRRKIVELGGATVLQRWYEWLAFTLLRLMNYGAANHPKSSGEFYLLERLRKEYFHDSNVFVVDAGANVGQFAEGVQKILPNAVIHCFEPSFRAYEKLQRLKSSRLECFQAALGAAAGRLSLFSAKSGSVKASLVPMDVNSDVEPVDVWKLDDHCQRNNINAIGLLKMDVEGFELEVLKGAQALINSGNVKFIQFEFGGLCNVVNRVFLKDFFDALPGYRIYRLLQRGIVEIHYKPRYEIFLTSNYLAVHSSVEWKK